MYISAADGTYEYHSFGFQFGAKELQGLIIFLTAAAKPPTAQARGQLRGLP